MERSDTTDTRTREVAALQQQQAVIGQLAQELQALTDQTATEHLRNELALMADDFVRRCNFLALQLMNEQRYQESFDWLSKAEKLTVGGRGVIFFEPHELLRRKALAAVHNNLGLFHFKRGEYTTAESCLAQAVAEEDALGDFVADNKGTTLLNLAQAEMALHAMGAAEQALLRAIEALEAQLEKCVVSVQILNTGLLAVRAYFLLAQCHEYNCRYSAAADSAMAGLKLHARVTGGGAKRATGSNMQLAVDLDALYHRCSEKERVFPKLLRPASAKPSAVRSKNAPFVVTSLSEPVQQMPQTLAPRPSRPSSARPSSASVRQPVPVAQASAAVSLPVGPHQMKETAPVRLLVQQPTLHSEFSDQTATLSNAAGDSAKVQHAAGDKREQDALVAHARQSCARQKPAPPPTKQVFRTSATGLERVYGSLSDKHKAAFDKLCATRAAPNRPTSLIPATVPYIARVVLQQPSIPSPTSSVSPHHHHQQQQQGAHSPRKEHKESVGTGNNKVDSEKESAAPACAGAIVPVTVHAVEQLLCHHHDGPPSHDDQAACTIQNFWRSFARRCETRRRVEAQRRRDEAVRETIRREEEARAMAHAKRVIEENERKLQREREADALAAANSRRVHGHGSSDGTNSLLLPSMLSSGEQLTKPHMPGDADALKKNNNGEGLHSDLATSSNSDVDGGLVPSALAMLMVRQQIHDSQQKVAVSTRETLEKAKLARIEKRAQKKRNGVLILQFVMGCLSTACVTARAVAKRSELLDQFAIRQRRKYAAKKVLVFFRRCVARSREREVQRRIEEERAAVFGMALVRLSQFAMARWSSHVVTQVAASRLSKATLLLQRVVRASNERRVLQRALLVRRRLLRQQRLEAARVIQRFALRFIGRIHRLAQWAVIRSNNFSNKQSYAASRIQHAWRWHAIGKPREAQRQRRYAELVEAAKMRQRHDQLIQELVAATEFIQRFYRGHLGRRQRDLRRAKRAKHAHAYLLKQQLLHAVCVLQRFSALVRAKREARLRREMKNYIIGALSRNERRVRSHLFPVEWTKYDAALAVLQRVGRGSIVRRAYRRYRILSVAAFEGRLANHAALVKQALAAAAGPPPSAAIQITPPVVHQLDLTPLATPSPAAAADPPAPSAHSEVVEPMAVVPVTETAPVEPSAAADPIQKDSSASSSSDSRSDACPPGQQRKYRKSTKRGRAKQPKKNASSCSATPPQASAASKELAAKKTIVQFLRTVVARHHYATRRELIQDSIVRHEAATYIQSTWRGFAVRRGCLQSKRAARESSVQQLLQAESASAIQATFRGHRVRKQQTHATEKTSVLN